MTKCEKGGKCDTPGRDLTLVAKGQNRYTTIFDEHFPSEILHYKNNDFGGLF